MWALAKFVATPVVSGGVVLAAAGTDFTPILVAVVGIIGGTLGVLLTLGPQRKNIAAQAQQAAVESIDVVRKALEERLADTERHLGTAQTALGLAQQQITRLEAEMVAARKEANGQLAAARASLLEAHQKRDRLQSRVEELETKVTTLSSRLPPKPKRSR